MKEIFAHIKKNPIFYLYATLAVASFCVLFSLLSMRILQSDDYSYSQYFKDGFFEFLKLTREHYLTSNGRALVHIAAQISLSLPRILSAFINAASVLFTAFFTFKFFGGRNEKSSLPQFIFLFIILLFTLSSDILKEAVMWTSGFYNYVFPSLIAFSALFAVKNKHQIMYPLCLFAGATTEQWGFVFIVMLFLFLYKTRPVSKKKELFTHFLPIVFAAFGYGTIFLSPATFARVDNHSHLTVSASLFDLPRLSEAFLSDINSILFIVLFLSLTIIKALSDKHYKVLLSGLLPIFLLILLPLHKSYTITFTILILYILLCIALFCYNGDLFSSILLSGAISSVVIMIPTNTFDKRIVFPFMCLLMLFVAAHILTLDFKNPLLKTGFSLSLFILCIIVLTPSYKGFAGNFEIEKENLSNIREAQKTNILNYNIDYDKNFAMRQMFNDGWFFTEFLSLYDIENCKVNLVSKNSTDVFLNGENLHIKGLVRNGETYIPMREFLEKSGGSIEGEKKVVMTLNGKTLTLENGLFFYTDSTPSYVVASENRLPDFYTLYIKEDLVKKAFGY